MILGTGIDVIEVERVQKAAAKEAFLRRVFTECERALRKAWNSRISRSAAKMGVRLRST